MKKLTLKNLNWYRIFMASMMIATLAIAIWVGVSAVQTAMKMKLSFSINPTVLVKITDANDNVIFNNATSEMASGVILDGNTLSFGGIYATELGANATLKITNLNNEKLMTQIVSGTATENGVQTTAFVDAKNGTTTITVSTVNTVVLQFDKVIQVTIPTQAGFTFNAGGSSVVKVGNTYYQPLSKDLQVSFTLNTTDYKEHEITVTGVNASDATITANSVTISQANLTADVVLTLSSTANLPYTIGSYTTSYANYGLTSAPVDGYKLADGVVYHSQFDGYKYIELGEYPQSLYSTEATLNGVPGTLGATTTLGGERYYYQTKVNFGTAGWYKFEPIRWIIIGAGTNNVELYGTGSTKNYNNEIGANQLLLLSEYGLEAHVFHNSYMTQFANSDLKTFLNGTFAKRSGLDIHIQSHLIATVTPKTTYADSNKNKQYDEGSSYNIFCLGYSNGNQTDTYDANSYLTTNSAPKKAIATGFAQTSGADTSSNYCFWWLRSGLYNSFIVAYSVNFDGSVSSSGVNVSNRAVRPSFVLNLSA